MSIPAVLNFGAASGLARAVPGPSAAQPGPRSTHHVQVKVMDFLSALSARVGDDTKATFGIRPATLLKRKPGRQQQHPSQQSLMRWLDLGHGRNVLLGNHQKMDGRPGIDVMKGQQLIILINLSARDNASGNFAKKAVFHAGIVAGLKACIKARSSSHYHVAGGPS